MNLHLRWVAAWFAAALLAGCANTPHGLGQHVPELGRQAPEAASGSTDKPGWAAHRFMVAAANPLATDAV